MIVNIMFEDKTMVFIDNDGVKHLTSDYIVHEDSDVRNLVWNTDSGYLEYYTNGKDRFFFDDALIIEPFINIFNEFYDESKGGD